jgi:gamma-glutamyltranspeptidase / glutathione hydrolase
MKKNRGIVAAGHRETARSASEMLRAGGNAFDAVLAAMLTACVAEPVLASPGGGGFLTAKPVDSAPVVYDFFAQTPRQKRAEDSVDFRPIVADFGTASQIFHIGLGSMATPGFIRGLFTIHRELGQLPFDLLIAPAAQLAREGVVINPFQSLITEIVAPILLDSPAAKNLHTSPVTPSHLISQGERHQIPLLADLFDALQHEGEDLFYRGEIGSRLSRDCQTNGGYLQMSDLESYRVIKRHPLQQRYRDAHLFTNPLPSLGGTLTAFSLGLMSATSLASLASGGESHLRRLARVMQLTQQLRQARQNEMDQVLSPAVASQYRALLKRGGISTRGTTQISVADREGNLASMTLSNGEGSGYVIPGTSIMMNNMLGEADLNPAGFHLWPRDQRLASMMAPTILLTDQGNAIVTGSGGSNRIRSAILQVISNLIDFEMSLHQAVSQPRIHFEGNLLSLETGIDPKVVQALSDEFPEQQLWPQKNLFFGGAHTVMRTHKGDLDGVGDERRGGVALKA